jgi:charged multivesicular body protein 3
MRGVERQVADIQREAKKTEKSVREGLNRGDARSARVLAKELVRTLAAVSRLHASRAQMNSVSLHLSENLALNKAVGAVQRSGQPMRLMNGIVKLPAVAATMRNMSREMMRAGVMEEMVGDALDSALDDTGAEEETEEAIDSLLAELAVKDAAAMPAAGRMAPPAAEAAGEAQEEEEDIGALQARLDAIRNAA